MSHQSFDALGFNPAPGSPESMEMLAATLSKVGNQLNSTHSTLARLGTPGGIWEGDAAEGFSKKVGELPKYLEDGHISLIEAAAALAKWKSQLIDFQQLAARYETEAEEARRILRQAESNPDLKLAGHVFETDEALQNAQQRLDFASGKVNEATEWLNAILRKAEELLREHEEAARMTAAVIRMASERAPDKPGFFDGFMDFLKGIGDKAQDIANDIYNWLKQHADTVYKIGDWLGWASAACDVLAVIFSETVIGAVVFEAIGRVLNAGAFAFHAGGWALGAKKGSWVDIGLDIVGFVPFGDLAKVGKTGIGALKGVTIPLHVAEAGSKAADSLKRADDIVREVGGTARNFIEEDGMRSLGVVGGKIDAVKITADNFKDRLAVSVARNFGDASLYRAASGKFGGVLDQTVPKLVESTPLGRIPALADSVKPITNDAGEVVGKYVDPRSWPARGYEAVTGARNLYKEGVRIATEDVEYLSDKVHDTVGEVRDATDKVFGGIKDFG
ncbi:WXG100 family type VII secretion target [Streptomyces cynarae]